MRTLFKLATSVSFALLLMVGVSFGQSNDATIEQHNYTSGELEARINQAGNNHTGVIRQGIVNPPNRVGAKKSKATIRQRGSSGDAKILQGRRGGFSAKSTARINQRGNSYAEILQGVGNQSAAETNNLARQKQRGNHHTAKIWQGVRTQGGQSTKTRKNEARQVQRNGNNSFAVIKQGVGLGSYAENNFARQLQNGSGHTARILQGTGGNWVEDASAVQRQFGNGHTALTLQTGMNETASITQRN